MKIIQWGRISTPPFQLLNRTVSLVAKAGWILGAKKRGELIWLPE